MKSIKLNLKHHSWININTIILCQFLKEFKADLISIITFNHKIKMEIANLKFITLNNHLRCHQSHLEIFQFIHLSNKTHPSIVVEED